MAAGDNPFSTRNDMKLVSFFMATILIMSFVLEVDPEATLDLGDPPRDPAPAGPPDPVIPTGREDVLVLSRDGHTSEGYTTDVLFTVDGPMVVTLVLELRWTDDIGANDEFGLLLVNDGEVIDDIYGTDGLLRIEMSDEAAAAIGGEFTATVEARDCPGQADPIPVDRDTGNDWHMDAWATIAVEEEG